MSKNYDPYEIAHIHQMSKFPEIKELIQEKNDRIQEVEKSRYASHYKLEPSPKPQGEIKNQQITRKEVKTKEQVEQEIGDVKKEYYSELKKEYQELSKHEENEFVKDTIEDLDGKDLDFIAKNGSSAFLDKEQSKDRLPTQMDDKTIKEFWGENKEDFSGNKEDLNKDDLKSESIQMDDQKMENLMEDDRYRFEFEKEEKQQEKNRDQEKPKPEPSDDYE